MKTCSEPKKRNMMSIPEGNCSRGASTNISNIPSSSSDGRFSNQNATGNALVDAIGVRHRADFLDAMLKEEQSTKEREDDELVPHNLLGVAGITGGIVGAVVGLAIVGPVGGVLIGTSLGQMAGMLGMIVEGSMGIGVLASGVAVGINTGRTIQGKLKQDGTVPHAFSVSKDGPHLQEQLRAIPNIGFDPVWKETHKKARQTYQYPKSRLSNDSLESKRRRYELHDDILATTEYEIPIMDKIFLLVSRIMNDKLSLPGHVYRYLLVFFRERCHEQGSLENIHKSLQEGSVVNDKEQAYWLSDFVANPSNQGEPVLHRTRRQDAHAIIHYVTAVLLEVRPSLATSPWSTELASTAVEFLVFGEIYDSVMQEIEVEYSNKDILLLERIAEFERTQTPLEVERRKSLISTEAIKALRNVPEADSAADKLRYIVDFMELLSHHFLSSVKVSTFLDTNSLLKMVCQHILVAKVCAIHAQVAFIEEFTRDEQILRGREGYSFVTLQASLQFLNLSHDFAKDLYG